MIDSENLRTASLYINNQLLSRGLLRDGRSIDFDRPGDNDHELADTMGRIMSVVNDLILRRDRDAEHRESLSTTLRTLRADSLRQSDNLSRLQDRYVEAQRKVNIADAEEAALRAQLKAAEATIHKLKDDAARTKKLVAETRAACANDVRKRDRQNDNLKKAVIEAGRARGERKSPAITTIHVTGDVGGDGEGSGATMDGTSGYDLRQETNGFLAQLAKGLSDENETLLSLIRTTNDSLKRMSGWEKSEDAATGGSSASGDSHTAVALPADPEELATDVESVLAHLRTLLTNPSFVPLEEVVVREQEIFRLRDGWEKMETRWQEAVHLIDGWRRRMAADGRPVDMEELKMGLRLSPVRVRDTAARDEAFKLSTLQEEEDEEEEEERGSLLQQQQQQGSPGPAESLHLVPAAEYEDMVPEYEEEQEDVDDSDAESSIFQDDVDVDMDESEPNVEILQHSTGDMAEEEEDSTSVPLPTPPKITPLEETYVGRNRVQAGTLTEKSRKRSGNLVDHDGADGTNEAPPPPPHGVQSGRFPQKRQKVSSDAENEKPSSRPTSGTFNSSDSSLDNILLGPEPEPEPEPIASKASSKTTARSTRSNVAANKKEPTPAPAKPVARTLRAVSQEKKDTPTRPLTRTRSARAIGATTSSSARTAPPSKSEPPKTRPVPASTTTTTATTTDMRPPPRPTRNKHASPANPPTTTSQADIKKSSPVEKPTPPTVTVTTEPNNNPRSAPDTPSNRSSNHPTISPTKSGTSRLPLPRNAAPQQSPITVAGIAAKLAASEREANAARVRAKLKAARLGSTVGSSSSSSSSRRVVSGDSAASAARDPIKRDRRDVSGASAATMSSTCSTVNGSLDENGTAGGVSIMRTTSESSPAASTTTTTTTTTTSSASSNSKTLVPASSVPIVPPPRSSSVKTRRNKITGGDGEDRSPSPPKRRGLLSGAAAHASSPSPVKEPGGKRKREVVTRRRVDRVASRRRSTLSPWELQSLIAGEVDVAPPTTGAEKQEEEE